MALAKRLAYEKALKIAKQYPQKVILAADSVAVAAGKILEKTDNEQDARQYMQLIGGRRHRKYTAICLMKYDENIVRQKISTTIMKFKRFTEQEIEEYIASKEWCGKAGGYSIEGKAGAFVSWISGSYSNIIGLPLYETRNLLLSMNICQK